MSATEVEIRDGNKLLLRPIEPGDKRALADGFERLSAESRYRRFFAPMSRLSGTDLRYLTEVDHYDHEAILATDADGEAAVGVARYVRGDDPTRAEVAVTVLDDWQGRGVATALLERLVAHAREAGIERFSALILADNEAAIELFSGLSEGEPEPLRSESGHVEVEVELPRGEAVSGSALGRLLREVAGGEIVANPWRVLKRRLPQPTRDGG